MTEGSFDGTCHAYIAGISTPYDYVPSLAAGIVFCALFGISMMAHAFQSFRSRMWWCYLFSIGCLAEVIGWAARTWSALCPYNMEPFKIQIATLIIAPTFFTAGIYIILGRLIRFFGTESSLLSPRMYLWIFCTCDLISLIVQAAGGALASAALSDPNGDTKPGTNIMVAGIIFQMAAITVFTICAADFLRRVVRHKLLYMMTREVKWLVIATAASVAFIYIRSIYRTVELLQGWSGYLITHEKYFIAFDGAMMVATVTVFNVFHPAWLLPIENSLT
ncbi:RTA1 like protein-domain-containing protein [Aspergillus welwitschiae]|uniref:RTA1 like protein-domain-containing protein n=1 Tax=Aspergillus welwitschiae TaxID=1341132 RepID=A0A3F3PQU1_9EURO|nr:RTA1 like protein-domain-containing protein [Aspergillus welwitschiae]RDH28686.1 RTA1 like protein-domain-containing protein [Aspergillus welwitschiae]